MNFEEAFKELLKGRKIRREDWKSDIYVWLDEDRVLKDNNNKLTSIIFNCDSLINDNFEIYKEPVLKRKEKEYLENFLRPFTKRYDKIKITKNNVGSGRFYIGINFFAFKDGEPTNYTNLPYFDKDDHIYEGMDEGKHYTPDELGLFEEERK